MAALYSSSRKPSSRSLKSASSSSSKHNFEQDDELYTPQLSSLLYPAHDRNTRSQPVPVAALYSSSSSSSSVPSSRILKSAKTVQERCRGYFWNLACENRPKRKDGGCPSCIEGFSVNFNLLRITSEPNSLYYKNFTSISSHEFAIKFNNSEEAESWSKKDPKLAQYRSPYGRIGEEIFFYCTAKCKKIALKNLDPSLSKSKVGCCLWTNERRSQSKSPSIKKLGKKRVPSPSSPSNPSTHRYRKKQTLLTDSRSSSSSLSSSSSNTRTLLPLQGSLNHAPLPFSSPTNQSSLSSSSGPASAAQGSPETSNLSNLLPNLPNLLPLSSTTPLPEALEHNGPFPLHFPYPLSPNASAQGIDQYADFSRAKTYSEANFDDVDHLCASQFSFSHSSSPSNPSTLPPLDASFNDFSLPFPSHTSQPSLSLSYAPASSTQGTRETSDLSDLLPPSSTTPVAATLEHNMPFLYPFSPMASASGVDQYNDPLFTKNSSEGNLDNGDYLYAFPFSFAQSSSPTNSNTQSPLQASLNDSLLPFSSPTTQPGLPGSQ